MPNYSFFYFVASYSLKAAFDLKYTDKNRKENQVFKMLVLKPPGTPFKYLNDTMAFFLIIKKKIHQWNAYFDASICYRKTYREKEGINSSFLRFLRNVG